MALIDIDLTPKDRVGPYINYHRLSINRLLESPELAFHATAGYLFYDFFCDASQLKKRFYKALPKVEFLVKEGLINGDRCYMSIKNCEDGRFGTRDLIRIHQMSDDGSDPEYNQGDMIAIIYSGQKRRSVCKWTGRPDAITVGEATLTLCCPVGKPSKFDEFDYQSNAGVWKEVLWSDLKKRIKEDEQMREAIKSHCIRFTNSDAISDFRGYQHSLEQYCDWRNELIEQGHSECTPCGVFFCISPDSEYWHNKNLDEQRKLVEQVEQAA